MKKNNILITGGNGFIGSCLAKNLPKNNNIFIMDKKIPLTVNKFSKNIKFIKINLIQKNKLFNEISKIKPQTIIHLAAQSTIDMVKKKRNSYIKNNIESTKNIVDACVKFNIPKLIFSSTAAVYKKGLKNLNENAKLYSNNIYGKTKIKNEKYIKKKIKDNKYGILRFFNVCSSDIKNHIGELHNPETHLLPILVNKIKKKKLVKIYGNNYNTYDGTCIRDYIHILDVISGIIKLEKYLETNKSDTFNLGSGIGFSIMKIIRECEKNIGKKANLSFVKKRFGDADKLICNIDKSKHQLKWYPKNSNLKRIIKDEIWWDLFLKRKKINRKFIY